MNITAIGTGYVGLVTGACLADLGNHVFCRDVDGERIDLLNSGGVPIYDSGLKELIEHNVEAGRLSFSTDVAASVAHGSLQFIPLGTVHRLKNPAKSSLELIEVQGGSYLSEDDIVRLDDVYGRVIPIKAKAA